ncbi:hypothetical protein Ciccas_013374, partial [Cichlidogyrus casuarinus]
LLGTRGYLTPVKADVPESLIMDSEFIVRRTRSGKEYRLVLLPEADLSDVEQVEDDALENDFIGSEDNEDPDEELNLDHFTQVHDHGDRQSRNKPDLNIDFNGEIHEPLYDDLLKEPIEYFHYFWTPDY